MPDVDQNPRYNGRIVLLPQVERLRAGDIILTSNVESASPKSGKQSALIRKATGGRFSHVLICSEPPILIEAIGTGVSTLSLMRCFAHAWENVRVLRYPDAAVAKRAAQLAQLEVGRDYSVSRAIQSIFDARTLAQIDDHGVFCSALVAQVFAMAGAAEFALTPVDKTTPATIDRLAGLIDVTDEVFRVALAPNNAEAMTALDGDAAPTPSALQTEISNRYAKTLLPAAEQLAHQLPQLGSTISPTMFGLIDFILRAYDAEVSLPAHSRANIRRSLEELDARLADLISSGELSSLFEKMKRLDDETHQQAIRESFNARPDIDADAMKSFLKTTRTLLAARRKAAESMSRSNRGRSKAAEAYLEIEVQVIANLAKRELLLEEILQRIR